MKRIYVAEVVCCFRARLLGNGKPVLQELLWVKRSCIASDFFVLVLSEAVLVLVLDGCLNRWVADG